MNLKLKSELTSDIEEISYDAREHVATYILDRVSYLSDSGNPFTLGQKITEAYESFWLSSSAMKSEKMPCIPQGWKLLDRNIRKNMTLEHGKKAQSILKGNDEQKSKYSQVIFTPNTFLTFFVLSHGESRCSIL